MKVFPLKLKAFLFGLVCAFPLAFSSQVDAAAPVAEWNVLFYLNGKNNLQHEMQEYVLKNLHAMSEVHAEKSGGGRNVPVTLPASVNVLVEYGTIKKDCDPNSRVDRDLDLCRVGVKRFRMLKGLDQVKEPDSAFEDLGRADMGDPNTLVDFAAWSRKFPAKKTVLYIFNHGSDFKSTNDGLFSFDDESGNSMNAREIADSFRKIASILGRPIELFVTDMCLVGSAEALGQMEGALKIYVASRENVQGYSISVIDMLRQLEKYSDLTAKRWAYQIVQLANRATTRTDFSAFNLAAVQDFESSLADLVGALRRQSASERRAFQSHFLACRFPPIGAANGYEFRDVLSCFYTMPGLREWPEYRRLTSSFYALMYTNSNDIRRSGLSIWGGAYRSGAASREALDDYRKLKFDQRAHWSDLIEMLGEGRADGRVEARR